jgi:hypothetical protein
MLHAALHTAVKDYNSALIMIVACVHRWGGPDEFFTGHMANGRRVVLDGAKSTRHVIAGLAQALTGAAAAAAAGCCMLHGFTCLLRPYLTQQEAFELGGSSFTCTPRRRAQKTAGLHVLCYPAVQHLSFCCYDMQV